MCFEIASVLIVVVVAAFSPLFIIPWHGGPCSYMEIYKEKVRDLLRYLPEAKKGPQSSSGGLRIRNHPKTGPYVEGQPCHLNYVKSLSRLSSLVCWVFGTSECATLFALS